MTWLLTFLKSCCLRIALIGLSQTHSAAFDAITSISVCKLSCGTSPGETPTVCKHQSRSAGCWLVVGAHFVSDVAFLFRTMDGDFVPDALNV